MSHSRYARLSPRSFRKHLADRHLLKSKSPAKANAKQLVTNPTDDKAQVTA